MILFSLSKYWVINSLQYSKFQQYKDKRHSSYVQKFDGVVWEKAEFANDVMGSLPRWVDFWGAVVHVWIVHKCIQKCLYLGFQNKHF